MPPSFSEQLKRIREEKGWSQQQLAQKVYVTRSSVARWENGTRVPDLTLLARLATCLGVEAGELMPKDAEISRVLRAIVVDDEPLILKGSLGTLYSTMPEAEIVGFTKPSEAINYVQDNVVNLAFLDIEMGKTNGFELCEKLLEINPSIKVAFLTGYPDYALKAWNTGARGFLVKPLEPAAVLELLDRLRIPSPKTKNEH